MALTRKHFEYTEYIRLHCTNIFRLDCNDGPQLL